MNFLAAATDFAISGGVIITLVVIALFFVVSMGLRYISLWFQAFVSGASISLLNIIGISLRKIPPKVIVGGMINLQKAGIRDVVTADLETHYLAGGNVIHVVEAMIAADKANIPLNWRQATAIDLAGRDILEAVRTSVNPKVIDCPANGEYITAVAKDGIQLGCRARVTVRTNLQQLVGGATEETIIARVGEGIINSIGSANTHLDVLEAPQKISSLVLEKGLDAQTAFEILSIDMAQIVVLENIGAKLRTDQAESDKKIAQAKAEERRTMAVAFEQEQKAKLIQAQAEVPLAMAEAFRSGNLGIIDYYKMKNIEADTDMRKSLAELD